MLNETRVAHGLQALAVPHLSGGPDQLGSGSADSAPRLHSSAYAARRTRNQRDYDEDDMMDEDEEDAVVDAELDPAEAVETLFRRLGVSHQPPPAAAAQPSHHYAQPTPHSNGTFTAASSSSSAHHPWPSAHAAASSHYPSMRTVLPALSGSSSSSSTRLEEIHTPHAQAHSAAATPLLSLAGREDILEDAYDSHSNVICPQCAALIPKTRFAAHMQYWCQNATQA